MGNTIQKIHNGLRSYFSRSRPFRTLECRIRLGFNLWIWITQELLLGEPTGMVGMVLHPVLDGTVPMEALAVMEVMDTVDGLMVATAGEDMVDVGLNQLLSLPEQLTLESMLMVMESQTLLFLTEPDSDGPPEPSPELMLMEMEFPTTLLLTEHQPELSDGLLEPSPELMLMEMEFPTMPLSTDQDMPPEDGEL